MESHPGSLSAPRCQISAEAQDDLFEIWRKIAGDSFTRANRIEDELRDLFESLGRMESKGTAAGN